MKNKDINYEQKIRNFNKIIGNNNYNISIEFLSLTNWDETKAIIQYLNNVSLTDNPNIGFNNKESFAECSLNLDSNLLDKAFSFFKSKLNINKDNSEYCKIFEDKITGLIIDPNLFINLLKIKKGIIILYNKNIQQKLISQLIQINNDSQKIDNNYLEDVIFYPIIDISQEGRDIIKQLSINRFPCYIFCKYKTEKTFYVIDKIEGIFYLELFKSIVSPKPNIPYNSSINLNQNQNIQKNYNSSINLNNNYNLNSQNPNYSNNKKANENKNIKENANNKNNSSNNYQQKTNANKENKKINNNINSQQKMPNEFSVLDNNNNVSFPNQINNNFSSLNKEDNLNMISSNNNQLNKNNISSQQNNSNIIDNKIDNNIKNYDYKNNNINNISNDQNIVNQKIILENKNIIENNNKKNDNINQQKNENINKNISNNNNNTEIINNNISNKNDNNKDSEIKKHNFINNNQNNNNIPIYNKENNSNIPSNKNENNLNRNNNNENNNNYSNSNLKNNNINKNDYKNIPEKNINNNFIDSNNKKEAPPIQPKKEYIPDYRDYDFGDELVYNPESNEYYKFQNILDNINNMNNNINSNLNNYNNLYDSQNNQKPISDAEIRRNQDIEMKKLERIEEERIKKEKEEKERKIKEEMKEKERIEKEKEEKELFSMLIPPEPEDNNPDKCTIIFRLPDGEKNIQRKFLKSDKISVLYDYIRSLGKEIYTEEEYNNFSIIQTFPFKDFEDKLNSTLEEEGLFPNSMLQIKESN